MEIGRWDALGFLYTREIKRVGNWRKENMVTRGTCNRLRRVDWRDIDGWL